MSRRTLSGNANHQRSSSKNRRITIEQLESRLLLSGSVDAATQLVIQSVPREADNITVADVPTDGEAYSIAAGAQSIKYTAGASPSINSVLQGLLSAWNTDANIHYLATGVITGNSLTFTSSYNNAAMNLVISNNLNDSIVEKQVDATNVGAPLDLKVNVEDSNNAIVTTDTSTVTLSLVGVPTSDGSLSGQLTTVALNGVATFNNALADLKIGTYTLEATAGDLNSGATNLIAYTGAPAIPDWVNLPATITAGTSFAPIVVLDDPGGNPVEPLSTITLRPFSGPVWGTPLGLTAVIQPNGHATFGSTVFTNAGTYTFDISVGGKTFDSPPLVVKNATFSRMIISGRPITNGSSPTALPNAAQGVLPTVYVALEDIYGNICTTGANQYSLVSLSISNGPAAATLGGTKLFLAQSGVATFKSLDLSVQGSYVLKAASDGKSATSNSFVVQTNVPAGLVFTTEPVNAYSGASLPPVMVTVENSFGDPIGNGSSITLALKPIGATSTAGSLGGTLVAKALNGVATFNSLVVKQIGSYTLGATDSSFAAPIASSNLFRITDQLVFTSVGNVSHNNVITVAVENGLGNIESADNTSTIILALNTAPGGALLAGSTTVVVINGVATFTVNELRSNSTTDFGTYTFKATSSDGAIASATPPNKFVSAPVKISS